MENNTPLVSVIMTAFNEEKYIREAIESVLAQTYKNFEFIIINDGSTDRTEEIILSFNDKRIRYVKNEQNLKLIASLNKGLDITTGDYITRMDSDDICLPFRFQKQVDFMEKNPEIGLSGAQLTIFGAFSGEMKYPLLHNEIKLGLLVTSCFGNNVVIFRKSIFEKHKLYYPAGYLHAEDYKCWTKWVSFTKTENLDIPLVKYRSHANSVSVKNKITQRETRNRVRVEYVIDVFNLQNDIKLATDFCGKISYSRIRAIKILLAINKKVKCFGDEEFKSIVLKLWYLDALEEVENNFYAFFKFPLIFIVSFKSNISNWINVLKHFIKAKFPNT